MAKNLRFFTALKSPYFRPNLPISKHKSPYLGQRRYHMYDHYQLTSETTDTRYTGLSRMSSIPRCYRLHPHIIFTNLLVSLQTLDILVYLECPAFHGVNRLHPHIIITDLLVRLQTLDILVCLECPAFHGVTDSTLISSLPTY